MKIYFYPKIDYKAVESPNSYISDLETELSKYNTIVNKKFNNKGVLDFFIYLFKTDIYLLNWIEDLTSYRYGKLQVVFFNFFLFCSKIFRKKIVWILHNKYSHDRKKNKWTDFLFKLMINKSDLILTHSTAGVDFIETISSSNARKVKYFIHPVKEIFPTVQNDEKSFDFFIWGSVFPYKGILEFLQFLKKSDKNSKFKVVIAGRCGDSKYKDELTKYLSGNIIYHDKLFSIEQLAEFSSRSHFTLFTYKPVSVLSSGSLMDSIRMRSLIIGPNHGAFKDLNCYSFMNTYDSLEEILDIRHKAEIDLAKINEEIEQFCDENSWEHVVKKIQIELEKINDKNE